MGPIDLWYIRDKPREGELLSSWIVRLAHAQGMKLESFCYQSWGRGAQVMSGDVDLYPSANVLNTLVARTGASVEQASATTLPALAGTLFESVPSNGLAPWVTFLGNRNHTLPDLGLSYCPLCLQDAMPYCRRTWRTAFATICVEHQILLAQSCPHCGAPYAIHRWDKGKRAVGDGHPITHCYVCRNNRAVGIEIKQVENIALIEFHWVLERAIRRGWVNVGGRPIDALLFFGGLGMLARILLDRRRCDRLRKELQRRGLIAQLVSQSTKKLRFECLNLPLRHEIMQALAWLWQDWPERFIDVCRLAKFRSSYLFDQAPGLFRNVPFWLWEPAHLHLYGKHYAPSDAEIDAAVAVLRRKGGLIRKIDLTRLLGVSWINKRTIRRLSSVFSA